MSAFNYFGTLEILVGPRAQGSRWSEDGNITFPVGSGTFWKHDDVNYDKF